MPLAALLLLGAYAALTRVNLDRSRSVGAVVDEFHGVAVYYNGGVNQSAGRNLAPDGYNLGIRYQCVEFVKRYYYQRFGHEMPEPRGNARDFFDPRTADGARNTQRGLLQFRNGSPTPPQADDILVLGPGAFNPYGHVAIVAQVERGEVEVVQQNGGPFAGSRRTFRLVREAGGWRIADRRVRGWLRMDAPRGAEEDCGGEPWLLDVRAARPADLQRFTGGRCRHGKET
jgi:hypothetical protein